MIKQYIKKILNKLLLAERSPVRLTLSFCLGIYMAFSPYIALQTWLLFPISWILRLNTTVALTTLYTVSNPITYIFLMVSSYLFGHWFLVSLLNIDAFKYNPSWVDRFYEFINKGVNLKDYIGTHLCFWCFFVGGNLLGLLVAALLYPIMRPVFGRLIKQFKKISPNDKLNSEDTKSFNQINKENKKN